MIWVLIIAVVGFILFKFLYDLNKDKYDLEGKTLEEKFKVVVNAINNAAYDGNGKVTRLDKRSFNLYQSGSNQIVNFQYSTGTLTITWNFKYYQKEVVHKKDFHEARNLSVFEQQRIADRMIEEMVEVVEEHKMKVTRVDSKGKLQDSKGAIDDYNEAINIKIGDAMFYNNRGIAKYSLQDYRGAIADFTKAIEIKPDFSEAYFGRAVIKFVLPDHKGAIADLTKAIEFEPDVTDYYFLRGGVKVFLHDQKGAIDDYTKAIEVAPDYADAYYRRGLAKLKLGQKDSGCLDFSKADELGHPEAYDIIKDYCN